VQPFDTVPEFGVAQMDALKSTVGVIERIAKTYRSTILIIPSRALWIGAETKQALKMHLDFVAALKRLKIPVVDVRPLMEATGMPMNYHFDHDGHWNAKGHSIAAQALARHILSR